MKKHFATIITIFTFILFNSALGQNTFQFLKIGDTVPDVELKLTGKNPKSIRLSEFKNKLIILDFWDVSCLSCIDAFLKMQELQEILNDKIQVILVTKNNAEQIETMQKIFPNTKSINLPFLLNDTLLWSMFPYTSVGLHAWIDENRVVRQVVSGNKNTTQENLRSFFKNGNINLTQIIYEQMDYVAEKPLWWGANSQQMKYMKFYSLFAGRIDYSGSGYRSAFDSTTKKIVWLKAHNVKPLMLFKRAYSKNEEESVSELQNRWLIEVKDPSPFVTPSENQLAEKWKEEHIVTYEIQVPPNRSGDIYSIFQKDLCNYYKVLVQKEKRNIKALALVRINNNTDFKSKGNKSYINISPDQTNYSFSNVSMSRFSYILETAFQFSTTPIIDKTNFSGKIDLDLRCNLKDLPTLKSELQKVGLDLIDGIFEAEMFIIKDN